MGKYINKTEETLEILLAALAAKAYSTTVVGATAVADLTVTGQVVDVEGNAVAGRFVVKVFFGESANNGIPYDFGDLVADTGSVIVRENVADAYCEVLTAADGTWGVVLTLGGADTVHTNAYLVGPVVVASTAVAGP